MKNLRYSHIKVRSDVKADLKKISQDLSLHEGKPVGMMNTLERFRNGYFKLPVIRNEFILDCRERKRSFRYGK